MLPWLLLTLSLAAPVEGPARRDPERSGKGMLIAAGVMLTLGGFYRLGVESFWWTRTELPTGDRFGRWSVPNVALITNLGNVLLVAPGVGLLLAGEHRYGRWEAVRHRADGARRLDIPRLRRTGLGLRAGLAVLVLGRSLFLPFTRVCTTNTCAYSLRKAEDAMRGELAGHSLGSIAAAFARKAPGEFFIDVNEWMGERARSKKPGRPPKLPEPPS